MKYHNSRVETYTVDLLDTNDQLIRKLKTSQGGSLSFDDGVEIKHAGTVLAFEEQDVNWNHVRLRPILSIQGLGDFPLGVYIPTAPGSLTPSIGGTQVIEMHDKTIILSRDMPGRHYCIPKNTNVIDHVVSIINDLGQSNIKLTPSDQQISDCMVFEPDVSWLTIVNTLLKSINYSDLTVDYDGSFVIAPHHNHQDQPTVYEFERGSKSIHRANWLKNQDIGGIPNKVVLVSEGSSSEEALIGTYTNNNPNSDYSYNSRGYWLTYFESGIEAETPAIITQLAQRKLEELTAPSTTIDIEHMWVNVALHDKVRFTPSNHEPMNAIIEKMSWNLVPGSLVNSVWRQEVDI